MAYFEITGIPLHSDADEFGLSVNIELERGRGLSVLSDDGELPNALMDAVRGRAEFSGEIMLNGMRIDPMPAKNRSIGILGDVPGVIPNRTVKENLELALKSRESSVSEDVFLVEQELSEPALAGLDDTPAKSLDDVSRTILAAARILISGCDLLLINRVPVPGFSRPAGYPSWNPGLHIDALFELKNLLRRYRATWISLLTDPMCVHVLSDRLAVYSEGHIIQEGSLRECLTVPASQLVADFLTFPRMNYRRMTVELDGTFAMLRGGRYGFIASEYMKRYLAPREGEEIVLGIRPDDLRIRTYETGDPRVLNLAKVTRVDSVPGALIVRLDVEGDEWLAMIEAGRPVFTGQLVELRPDPDRLFIFHPISGANLLD